MVQGRLVAAIVIGISGLTACATPGFMPRRDFPCPGNGAICEVEVAVDLDGGRCVPRIVHLPKNVLVMPAGEHNVIIRWILTSQAQADYEFMNDGFDLKSGTTGQFPSRGKIMGGRAFQVINAHTDNRSYEYYLLVHRKHSTQTCKLDPFINNVN